MILPICQDYGIAYTQSQPSRTIIQIYLLQQFMRLKYKCLFESAFTQYSAAEQFIMKISKTSN